MHQYQLPGLQGADVQRRAAQAQVFATNAQVLTARRRCLGRVTRDRQLLVERLAALVVNRKR
ncbi:hypothetical protein A244_00555 [Pseudomonas syringae pv. actinidiae ICMP 18807]|uniref:Uncharacterized protein n=1 Tax=Pseudomonas syringae pv. actinidiae ICMP 18807 TaxID=1194404 RepID=S6WDR7_PSESF|nr:hypothetical protein A244_00555 [Pseudomonas syringae pv. actinidiae ICMP 18807]